MYVNIEWTSRSCLLSMMRSLFGIVSWSPSAVRITHAHFQFHGSQMAPFRAALGGRTVSQERQELLFVRGVYFCSPKWAKITIKPQDYDRLDGCEIRITSWKRWFIPRFVGVQASFLVVQDFATIHSMFIWFHPKMWKMIHPLWLPPVMGWCKMSPKWRVEIWPTWSQGYIAYLDIITHLFVSKTYVGLYIHMIF